MQHAATTPNPARRSISAARRRDEGMVLPFVLVLIIVGTLIVLPVLTYASAVSKHNTVLSAKTSRLEAVKSGLRLAMADPQSLYDYCGNSAFTTLASTNVSGHQVTTSCEYIDHQVAQGAEQLRTGVTTTEVGRTAPDFLTGSFYTPSDPLSTDEWQSATTDESTTDQIWLPLLPVHALDRRSPNGYDMPTGYPTCTVYFPGTYVDPITLDGPTYFTSGIYYFEDEVTVAGGASVTVGQGSEPGCSTDQEAAFYAQNAPTTHNINGLGATFVLGYRGRFVVEDQNGAAISIRFNRRYVAPGDPGAAPSADVSIMTVNGDIDPASIVVVDGQIDRTSLVGIDLESAGIIDVPLSMVGGGETPVAAPQQEYLPSIFTPAPSVPEAPTGVTVSPRNGGAIVSWTAPDDGGSPITGYVVTVTGSSGSTCTTNGATTCAITGLLNNEPVRFTVVAENSEGSSVPSDPSSNVTPTTGHPMLTAPSKPSAPSATQYTDVTRVTWSAPASTGNAPLTGYTITESPDGQTCTIDLTVADPVSPLHCDFSGLSVLTLPLGHEFTVTATNAVGSSPVSDPSLFPIVTTSTAPVIVTPPSTTASDPTPVIDIDLPDADSVDIRIPGYVSVPQGRVAVDNPHGHDVQIKGGVLAARIDVSDSRASGPQSIPIGFVETIVQRKFRIVSRVNSGRETSTAIVQVNQNGAYAINSWEVQ